MEYVYSKEIYSTAGIKTILSEQDSDEQWDSFIGCTSSGYHEQSSMWASVKMMEDWKPVRVKFIQNQNIVGGFQLLYKHKKYVGRIGYISKGPVIDHYDPEFWQLIINRLISTVRQYKIRALIVIPPEYNFSTRPEFDKILFTSNKIFPVINATLRIDLTQSNEEILKGMRRRLRTTLKSAEGLNFREGTREELETFFNLMLITCKHQGVSPNPPSLNSMNRIWSLFSEKDMVRLNFVEKEKEIVSGILALKIRDLFIAWKIGWSGKYRSLSPNAVLIWEMIQTAKKEGFKVFDFVSVDYEIAQLINDKKPLTENVIKNHTFFKMGFGGSIVRLPDSYIYIPDPVLNKIYRLYCKLKKPVYGN
jgi:lipid II:glycine glycyltransferase (peptidoglycan interpeptide bridge formation enzyme)